MDHCQTQVFLARYHYLLDDREFGLLGEMLSPEVVMSLPGGRVLEGGSAVVAFLGRPRATASPLSHHLSNVVVDDVDGDRIHVRSKYLAVCGDGSVVSGIYSDVITREGANWMFLRRDVRRMAGPGISPA